MDTIKRIISTKNEIERHLLVVEHLVEADLPFIETADSIYEIPDADATFYSRTGALKIGTKQLHQKKSWSEIVELINLAL